MQNENSFILQSVLRQLHRYFQSEFSTECDFFLLSSISSTLLLPLDRGSTVVKVLCYKSEGRWFDPSLCHWNFSLTQNPSDRTMALGSTQPLNRNEYQKHVLGVKAAGV